MSRATAKAVLHVIAPVRFGGGEALLCSLAEAAAADVTFYVAALFHSEHFKNRLQALGAEYIALSRTEIGDGIPKREMLKSLWRLPVWVYRLIRVQKDINVSAIHCHGFPASIVGALLRFLGSARSRLIYTHHNHVGVVSRAQKAVFSMVFAAFDNCTTVSTVCESQLNEAYSRRGTKLFGTIYNCADRLFYETRLITDTSGAKVRAVHVARFVDFKNHRLLLLAVAKLPNEVLGRFELILVGDGPLRPEMESLVKTLGIDQVVRFVGFVDAGDLPRLLGTCHFAVMPSKYEGFGISAVECMAQGLPIVALDIPIMREVVGSGGALVEPASFACGLIKMISEYRRFAEAARVSADRFRPSSIWGAYRQLYHL